MNRLRILTAVAFAAVCATTIGLLGSSGSAQLYATYKPNCAGAKPLCTEVADPKAAFPNYSYVGHDEPSMEFYSTRNGSGNNMAWNLTLPTDPAAGCSNANANTCNVMLHPAFWFGMAMCDTQSYPQQISTCTPDSDSNIVDPTKTTKAPGVAFMELQFYPPGWAPQFAGSSCDPTQWCTALNIDSLSENPLTGSPANPTIINSTCGRQILGGTEYVNFAYLTHSGAPIGPPNPLDFNPNPSTPGNPSSGDPQGNPDVLFMNSGDKLSVTLHNSASGLVTTINDQTTHTTGFMTASAANHFGQIQAAPAPSTSCNEIDYNFHPMYATSSPQTRVLWAAHTYNVAFSDEIGHFDWCSHLDADQGGICGPPTPAQSGGPVGLEGKPGVDQEAAESPTSPSFDDYGCFPAEESLKYQLTGCVATNTPGFDGAPYLASDWANGSNSAVAPSPILFSSPLSAGKHGAYSKSYPQMAFEADLPRIEAADLGGSCVRTNPGAGSNCVNPPPTDDPNVSAFYPYFVLQGTNHNDSHGGPAECAWALGNLANAATTINNFGGSSTAEYGPLYPQPYYVVGGGGKTQPVINDFNSGPASNPC